MVQKEYKTLQDTEMPLYVRSAIENALADPDSHWQPLPPREVENIEQLQKDFKLMPVTGRVYHVEGAEDGTYFLDVPMKLPEMRPIPIRVAGKRQGFVLVVSVWPLVTGEAGKASVKADHWEVEPTPVTLKGQMTYSSDSYLSMSGINPDEEDSNTHIYMLEWWTDPIKFAQSLREAAEALEAFVRSHPDRDIQVSID